MKYYPGIIACLFLITACHTSKRPVLYNLQEHADVELAVLQDKYPAENSAYLYYKRDISHDLKPDVTSNSPRWYFFESYHWKEVILNSPDASEAEAFSFELGPDEEVRFFRARVASPGGSAEVFNHKDLKRKKVSGGRNVYFLDLEATEAGATIEVAYEIERGNLLKAPPMSHDVALQLDKPAEYLEFGFTYPESWDVQVKQTGPYQPLETTESEDPSAETRTLTYSSANVSAFRHEPFGPYFKQVAPYFHVKVNHLEVGNVVEKWGDDSWERVAGRYASLPTPSKREKERAMKTVQELGVEATMEDAEKLALILEHVDKDITISASAEEGAIWKENTGTALDVTAYTRALLGIAGIETEYLVAHTAADGYFDEEFITDEQIYAPLLKAYAGGESVYIFPDKKGVPVGFIPAEYANQIALLYTAEGYKGFATIPLSPDFAYEDTGHYDLFVNGDGEVRAEVRLELGQHTTYMLNQALLKGDEEEKDLIERLLAHSSDHISMLSYTINDGAADRARVIKASYSLGGCLEPQGENRVIRSCGLFEPVNGEWLPIESARTAPILLPADLQLTNTIRVIYPEAWDVVSPVQNVAENAERILFERTHASARGQIDVNQHLILKENLLNSMADYARSNSAIAHSINLPLGTELSSIELSTIPPIDLAHMRLVLESDPGGPWTLVVSSTESYDAAVSKVQELERNADIDAMPVRIFGNGPVEDRYHILLGMFTSRQAVEDARVSLSKEIPFDSWIAVLNPQMTAVLTNTDPITY